MWTPFPNQLLMKFAGKSLNGFDMALMEISLLKKIWFALTSTTHIITMFYNAFENYPSALLLPVVQKMVQRTELNVEYRRLK